MAARSRCYPVQYVASVRLFASRFNPLGALQQVAQLALTPQQGEPYQQDQYAANPPTAPAPELPSSSVSREEIQAMESGAAATSQQNLKLDKEIADLETQVVPLELRVKKLREQGELDKQKAAKLRKFQDSVSPETLLNSIASLGANPVSNGLFEAPIVFLQPSALTLSDKLQLDEETLCENQMIQDNEKMESLSGNYKTMEDPQKIDEEIEKLQKEFTDLKKEGDRYKTEKKELKELVEGGSAEGETKLKKVNEKIHANDVKQEELRLRITSLRQQKEKNVGGQAEQESFEENL